MAFTTCKHELRCSHFLHLREPESLICHREPSPISSPSLLPSTPDSGTNLWLINCRQINAIKLKMRDTNDLIPQEFVQMLPFPRLSVSPVSAASLTASVCFCQSGFLGERSAPSSPTSSPSLIPAGIPSVSLIHSSLVQEKSISMSQEPGF